MTEQLSVLILTAASIGFIHTLAGPDHYLQFIVVAKARNWSMFKTAWITFLCGLGHIASSVLLGFIGIILGIAVFKLENVESLCGELAEWLLLAFGLAYTVWGIRRAIKNRPHKHAHCHADGAVHEHDHGHIGEHAHPHEESAAVNLTPWVLFTIFIFGPCEPLIPILIYPAAEGSWFGVLTVTIVFGGVTILTMLGMVLVLTYGLNLLPVAKLERYNHALAGLTILMCGLAIQFLGM